MVINVLHFNRPRYSYHLTARVPVAFFIQNVFRGFAKFRDDQR